MRKFDNVRKTDTKTLCSRISGQLSYQHTRTTTGMTYLGPSEDKYVFHNNSISSPKTNLHVPPFFYLLRLTSFLFL